jgi:AmpD protein
MKLVLNSVTGLIDQAEFLASPNCDEREAHCDPDVIIIHCISLPPGEYGSGDVSRFFQNNLDAEKHPYFASISHLTVSSHFFIERSGHLIQHVPTHKRAWHAGESVCLERPKVNDFSIGIELEGLDTDTNGFTDVQYQCLSALIEALRKAYPVIKADHLFAHSDIAPERKPDPGPYFDWGRVF